MSFVGKFAAALGLIVLAIVGTIWAVGRLVDSKLAAPDPVTIASASLQGLQEQNRLSAFAARFVSVTTSRQTRFGLSAQKTLIMPGLVRYDVDLSRLRQQDVTWNAATKTLRVTLPPVEPQAPQIDLTKLREYDSGGVLARISDAETTLDAANRRAGQAQLVTQAREPAMMRLAQDATRRAVERSFAMPLRAAGIAADVEVGFATDGARTGEYADGSRPLNEVLGNAR